MTAPSAPSPTRRLSAENRRQQILETAAALFIERGFEAVGMNDIARELQTSRPTVYAYFTSTQDMLRALLDERLPAMWERLRPILPTSGEFRAETFSALFLALLHEHELLLLLHSGGGPIFREQRGHFLQQLGEWIEPYRRAEARQPHILHLITLLLEAAAVEQVRADRGAADSQARARAIGQFIAGGVANTKKAT
ncbi:TetR/AcrR family transcriptional regulator [Deinococcus humi]|uniref:AcrR family transcriptional regulator n=1 Tax=Deinococcus humi TaxID=662880 RepID=A0A7W8NI95_9DEIO|nr:TetR/AcrR family transcriptional regulator [Deinococcus humi]MBB5364817.1 AcrR family transcriptional regulator [Deinococcus humi]GGO34027.1 TetR family transcriptional regulator [Deinococcus humi]